MSLLRAIDGKTVQTLARVAGLQLSAGRCERLAQFLDLFMQDAEKLKAVDLEGIEPPTLFRSKEGEA